MVARNNFVSITGYFMKTEGEMLKSRMQRLRRVEHRLSESRVVEDALKLYIPMLEARLLPTHMDPAPRRRRAVGE